MHEFDAGGSAKKSGTIKETNEQSHIYGGVLSHCLKMPLEEEITKQE